MTSKGRLTGDQLARCEWIAGHDPMPVRAAAACAGHGARSAYVETFWLPLIGPTATLALRRLASYVEARGEALVPLVPLARELGVTHRPGDLQSPLLRALDRLAMFKFTAVHAGALEVCTIAPPLPHHFAARLPDHLKALWDAEQAAGRDTSRTAAEAAAGRPGGLSSSPGGSGR